jgi:hypothetical protein
MTVKLMIGVIFAALGGAFYYTGASWHVMVLLYLMFNATVHSWDLRQAIKKLNVTVVNLANEHASFYNEAYPALNAKLQSYDAFLKQEMQTMLDIHNNQTIAIAEALGAESCKLQKTDKARAAAKKIGIEIGD